VLLFATRLDLHPSGTNTPYSNKGLARLAGLASCRGGWTVSRTSRDAIHPGDGTADDMGYIPFSFIGTIGFAIGEKMERSIRGYKTKLNH